MIGWIKLGAAVGVIVALLIACKVVNNWHERSEQLTGVQEAYAGYRQETQTRIVELVRRETTNREITDGYIGVIQKQAADLRDAHARYDGLRLQLSTRPRVPAAVEQKQSAAEATPEGPREQPALVDLSVGEITDRFAQCDATAAQLNALIDWENAQ